MVSKIVKYGVIMGLLAALVGGTGYILARPTEAQVERGGDRTAVAQIGSDNGNGGGRGNAYRAAEAGALLDPERGGQGVVNANSSGQGNGQSNGQAGAQGNGQAGAQGNGQGRGQGGGNGAGGPGTGLGPNAAAAEVHDWLTVPGTVLVADNELTLQTATGELVVGMGQMEYREQAGFTVTVGDEVVVYGFYEDGEFKAGTVENHTTGATLTLRDATGRPMWAGNGNQRNQP